MRIRFWGTRGSIPTPGADTVRYGGNTSCVQVITGEGPPIVLDAGTGARGLGHALLAARQGPIEGHLLIGHTHWDHIQGIPFFAPFYVPGDIWNLYAPLAGTRCLRDTLAGQMDGSYFPIPLERLGAQLRCHDLEEGSLRIGAVEVRTQALNHSGPALGYRLSAGGRTVVYACDHEPSPAWCPDDSPTGLPEEDERHLAFLRGADLVIHDAQYTSEEMERKRGWGHSCIDYVVDLCRRAGVPRVVITHHDPGRGDDALDRLVADLGLGRQREGHGPEVIAASEGLELDLG